MSLFRRRAERPEGPEGSDRHVRPGIIDFGPFGPPAKNIRAPRSARGFTLLEVLLAFALLALSMGLLLGMLSGGLRQVADAERETEATLHAQSLLDALGTLAPIAPGQSSGTFDDDRYRWTLDIREIQDPAPVAAPTAATPTTPLQGGPKVLRVALEVQWGDGDPRRRLQMVTLRVRQPTEIAAVPE
jgi:general secretion pathway protein I